MPYREGRSREYKGQGNGYFYLKTNTWHQAADYSRSLKPVCPHCERPEVGCCPRPQSADVRHTANPERDNIRSMSFRAQQLRSSAPNCASEMSTRGSRRARRPVFYNSEERARIRDRYSAAARGPFEIHRARYEARRQYFRRI